MLALLLFFTWLTISNAEDSIKIGYMVCNSLKETKERFDPLTKFLTDKIGKKFEAVYLNTYDVEEYYRDKKIDFIHVNSVMYVILRKNYQAKLVIAEKKGLEEKNTVGMIIVRNESDIKTVKDLKNKRFMFGPELSPSGYVTIYDLLLRNGIDPENDLAYYAIPQGSYKHEKVLYAIYYQAFDAGAAKIDDLRDAVAEKKFQPDDFRVIAKSDMVTYCTLAARKEIDDNLIQQVKNTLLGLKQDDSVEMDGERLLVLKRAWLDAFVEIEDKDYDLLREMAKRIKIPPYE